MNRAEILSAIKPFFDVNELVCNHTYSKWGEQSWQFLDTDFLHALLIVRRDILKAPMWCNSATLHQRGLRCNRCDMVRSKSSVYLSAHCLGKAGDFTITGMTAEEARRKIKANANLLPCNIRLEKNKTWLHLDVLPQYGINQKVYEFSV